MSEKIYKFGGFSLFVNSRRLIQQHKSIQLSQRAFDILLYLIERRGEVVKKDALLEAVWSNVFVEEINLAVHISAIRRVLGEKRGENKFIETVSGRGYCFVAPVEEAESSDDFPFYKDLQSNQTSAAAAASGTQGQNRIYSLAVLPFSNETSLSSEASNLEYLTDGITESLIDKLAQLPQLKIFSRNAVFRYKNQNPDLREVGFLLGAEMILTGRLALIGEQRLEVRVELVNVSDQSHVWGFEYQCHLTDIFKVKSEIALAIAENLHIKLRKSDALLLERQRDANSEAYKLYLKGRYLARKRTREDLLRAFEFFERALKKDARCAQAYAGIADAYFLLGVYRHEPAASAIPKAKIAIEHALHLDQTLSEVYASNANILYRYDWKWEEAERAFKQAIALNPNNADAHQWYSQFLLYVDQPVKALLHLQKALELDPFSLFYNTKLAMYFNCVGEYGKAITQLEETLEIEPQHFHSYYVLSVSYAKLGLYETALATAKKAVSMYQSFEGTMLTAWIHALSKNHDQARRILNEALANSEPKIIEYYDVATVYAALGEMEKSFGCLEKAIETGSFDVCGIKAEPRFESLRGDSRFESLLKKINLN